MLRPPTTNDPALNRFLEEVASTIRDRVRPEEGWSLSDFASSVSEVISDKRDLIDIVTQYDNIEGLSEEMEVEIARLESEIQSSMDLLSSVNSKSAQFAEVMAWWDQNYTIIFDAQKAMEIFGEISAALEGHQNIFDQIVAATEIAENIAAEIKATEEAINTAVEAAKTSETNAADAAARASASETEVSEARDVVVAVHQALKPGGEILENLNNLGASVEEAASQASVARDAAAASATTAQGHADGATQARVDAQAAQAAAEAAALTVVDDARTQVAALVDELEVSFSDAQELVATSAGHAEAAAGSTAAAAGSAAAARESADAADASATAAGVSAGEAAASATTAQGHVEGAAGHAATAQQAVDEVQQAGQAALTGMQDHVTAAEAHATAAGAARTGAETARDEAVAAAESATTGAPVGGWQRATLHQDVQDSLSRADTAMQSMPRATGSAPGGVTLAGDLGGTADAPTVPGLAGKASAADVAALVKRLSLLETILDPLILDASASAKTQVQNELARRGLDYNTVENITFSIDARNAQKGSLLELFAGVAKLREAPLLLNTSSVTNMGGMFSRCSSLTKAPALNTSSVTSMVSMFYSCSSLTKVPVMDTSKVTNMNYMFYSCSSLTTVPVMDTSQVTNMSQMFSGCSSLESVTLPGMGSAFASNQTLDMRATKLNASAANALMQSLGTVPAAAAGSTLKLPATAAGADTSIATAKNWQTTIG